MRQIRDLLECVWLAVLETATGRSGPRPGPAALWVVLDRDGGDLTPAPSASVRLAFEQQVCCEITKQGVQEPRLRIVRDLFTALADPTGVLPHRRGALERVQLCSRTWPTRNTSSPTPRPR